MELMYFFRRHMKKIFLITIVGFVLATFAGFGGYYFFGDKQETAAKVNSEKIPKDEFNYYLNQAIRARQDKTQEPINDSEMNSMKSEVLRDLIQESLFLQEAEKAEINASDQETMAVIRSYPLFQKDGVFNARLYFESLKYILRQTPEEFENSTKKKIITNKMKMLIVDSVKVTEKELAMEYSRRNNGNLKKYVTERESFRQNYISEKKYVLLNEWFRQVAGSAKINVFLKD